MVRIAVTVRGTWWGLPMPTLWPPTPSQAVTTASSVALARHADRWGEGGMRFSSVSKGFGAPLVAGHLGSGLTPGV